MGPANIFKMGLAVIVPRALSGQFAKVIPKMFVCNYEKSSSVDFLRFCTPQSHLSHFTLIQGLFLWFSNGPLLR